MTPFPSLFMSYFRWWLPIFFYSHKLRQVSDVSQVHRRKFSESHILKRYIQVIGLTYAFQCQWKWEKRDSTSPLLATKLKPRYPHLLLEELKNLGELDCPTFSDYRDLNLKITYSGELRINRSSCVFIYCRGQVWIVKVRHLPKSSLNSRYLSLISNFHLIL